MMNNEVPDISGELACLIAYIIFLMVCYSFYKIGIAIKHPWFVALIAIYLIFIWLYFELINQMHNYLRNNKILYIEFGHASLELILLMMFSFLNAFVLIGIVAYRRKSRI
jgi:hypothetical protein